MCKDQANSLLNNLVIIVDQGEVVKINKTPVSFIDSVKFVICIGLIH